MEKQFDFDEYLKKKNKKEKALGFKFITERFNRYL